MIPEFQTPIGERLGGSAPQSSGLREDPAKTHRL
jgi:hypothetical protein